jgi:hypothetical protein
MELAVTRQHHGCSLEAERHRDCAGIQGAQAAPGQRSALPAHRGCQAGFMRSLRCAGRDDRRAQASGAVSLRRWHSLIRPATPPDMANRSAGAVLYWTAGAPSGCLSTNLLATHRDVRKPEPTARVDAWRPCHERCGSADATALRSGQRADLPSELLALAEPLACVVNGQRHRGEAIKVAVVPSA